MSAPREWWRSTIRVRLTLLYAGAFFLAGAVLVALNYLFLAQALEPQFALRASTAETQLSAPEDGETDASRPVMRVQDQVQAQFWQVRDETLRNMLTASLIMLGVAGIIAAGSGWLLAGQALHPLREITATARRIADRSLHERIALAGPDDEIKHLADTLDAMFERLDRAFNSQQRFVANASHELRTPLTINRTLIEVALDDPRADERLRQLCATLLAVNQRHERLIDGLLTLVSSEQRITDPAPVDLADVARHIVSEAQAAAREAGVEVRTRLSSAPVAGDPVLLERLVHNLVDNAIRYNLPEGGRISVVTRLVDGEALLIVENSGQPIPLYDIPGLFEPFRRLATTSRVAATAGSSRGAGLGLSIVRSVAQAHGGEVHALPGEEGGLVVQVRLSTHKVMSAS